MRILFVLSSPEFLRYYDSTMKLMVAQGHEVLVGVNALRERKHARLDELIDDDRIEIVGQIPARGDMWTGFARAGRGTFDFVRYLHPRLAGATALRTRMKRKSCPPLFHVLDRVHSLEEPTLNRLTGWLRRAEAAVPVSRKLTRFLGELAPDAVVVSPLVDAASEQVDVVRAAQALGIPAVLAVASWDNLTNKGHMRVLPDRVMVWNEHQRTEAVTLHGVPAERVDVTGAQLFDRWFERKPSQSRADFCALVGLPADRPIVLYTCSSVFIARSEFEVPFVQRWLTALRASNVPELRDASVLIRPHPFNGDAWEDADFSLFGAVSIWPRRRYTPAAEAARTGFFDSLSFSSAIVGINTSAMIEAAILRKPVLSLLTPEFAGTQEGTLHFHYLLPENGGFLRVADSIKRHLVQLAEVLKHPEATRAELDRFVATFIRPHGIDTPCTPILVDALLAAAAASDRVPVTTTVGSRLLRVLAWPVAALLSLDALGDANGKSGGGWLRSIRRTVRNGVRAVVVEPARGLVRTGVLTMRACRRLARRTLRFIRALPARTWRRVRHLRYHLAMRVRGQAVSDTDGGDGRR